MAEVAEAGYVLSANAAAIVHDTTSGVAVFVAEGDPVATAVVAAMRAAFVASGRLDDLAAAWRAGVTAAGSGCVSALLAFAAADMITIIHAGDLAIHASGRALVRPHIKLDETQPMRVRTRAIGLPGAAARAELAELPLDGATHLVVTSVGVWAPLGATFGETTARSRTLPQELAVRIDALAVAAADTSIGRAMSRVPRVTVVAQLPDIGEMRTPAIVPVAAQRFARRAIRSILARSVGTRAAVLIGSRGSGKTSVLEQLGRAGMIDASTVSISASQLRRQLKANVLEVAGTIAVDRLVDAIGTDAALGLALAEALDRGRIGLVTTATSDELATIAATHTRLHDQLARVPLGEPSRDELAAIVATWTPRFANRHCVRIEPEAMTAAVELTLRFPLARAQPEAALFALEQACLRAGHAGIVSGCVTGRGAGVANRQAVCAALADQLGVAIEVIGLDDASRARELGPQLGARLHGQQAATDRIASAVVRGVERREREPARGRPLASLLLLGQTGTGKTEAARLLAASWFADRRALITLDLSEYSDPASVARLIGAPPGYTGYGTPSLLEASLAANPRQVVLFDELEKACTPVHDLLLQILDGGRLRTGRGTFIDFSDAIVVLTSNLGASNTEAGFRLGGSSPGSEAAERKRLEEALRPELIARVDEVVRFELLTKQAATAIGLHHLARCADALVSSGRMQPSQLPPLRQRLLSDLGGRDRFSGGAREVLRLVERILAEERRPPSRPAPLTVVCPYYEGGRDRLAAGFSLALAPDSDVDAIVDAVLTHSMGGSLLYVAHDKSRLVALVGDEAAARELAPADAMFATGRVRADIAGRPIGELIDRLLRR